jgi:hypothetical protein
VNIAPRNSMTAPQKIVQLAVNAWEAATAIDIDYRIDIYTPLEDPLSLSNLDPDYDIGDHTHLRNAGYDLVATTIAAGSTFTLPTTYGTQTVTHTDGTVQTVASVTVSGLSGGIHTLRGTGTAGWGITKTGGGFIYGNYIDVRYSVGSPAFTWFGDTGSTIDTYSDANGWEMRTGLPITTTSSNNLINIVFIGALIFIISSALGDLFGQKGGGR